jgi:pimeloyl-ACP methyl ester carboxylesterase
MGIRETFRRGETVVEFFSTAQGRFAVNDTGPREGRPVVLVAGLGDDHASWESVLPYLAPEYRCLTFDNRGIGDLTQPALVLAGRHDILTRKELSQELADTLPDAQLELLDTGHMTFWEAPEAWGHLVRRWLQARELT